MNSSHIAQYLDQLEGSLGEASFRQCDKHIHLYCRYVIFVIIDVWK